MFDETIIIFERFEIGGLRTKGRDFFLEPFIHGQWLYVKNKSFYKINKKIKHGEYKQKLRLEYL